MATARLLHILAAVVWIGGMFFANFALRPSLAALEPGPRLTLLAGVFRRFLAWIALAIVLFYASGFYLIASLGGMRLVSPSVHAMLGIATLMTVIYIYLVVGPYRGLAAATAARDFPKAAASAKVLRLLVATNLVLGLVTIAVAVLGRSLG